MSGFILYSSNGFNALSTQMIKKSFIEIFAFSKSLIVLSSEVPAPKTKIGFSIEFKIIFFEFAICGKFKNIFFENNFPSLTNVI